MVSGLPANTVFDLFIIQVPTAPFGVAWYIGDIRPLGRHRVGNFVGRFSSETFIISPGVAPTVNEFPSPPAFVPEATTGIATNPIQMYHLGLWFNSASDAAKAGCPATHTPFNGEHNAGIQVLNTATFPPPRRSFDQNPITVSGGSESAPPPATKWHKLCGPALVAGFDFYLLAGPKRCGDCDHPPPDQV